MYPHERNTSIDVDPRMTFLSLSGKNISRNYNRQNQVSTSNSQIQLMTLITLPLAKALPFQLL
jgi:hypothetical protein